MNAILAINRTADTWVTYEYAKRNTISRTAGFISLTRGNRAKASRAKSFVLEKAAWVNGVVPVFLSFDPRDWKFKR